MRGRKSGGRRHSLARGHKAGGLRQLIGASIALICLTASQVSDAEEVGGNLLPVTLDDVLKIEGFGDAKFSPDGRWLVFNQVPPYDQLKDYSFGLYGYIQSGHQVRILDVVAGGTSTLHPGFDPGASSYLLGFSPDSRYVLALEYKLGHFSLVGCRTGEDDCHRFEVMPDIRDRYFGSAPWNERIVWTSDATFVMPVREAYQPGSELRSRAIAGRFLSEQWNRAWAGTGSTATEVLSTGLDRTGDWAGGQLAEFDLDRGVVRELAQGRFAGVRLSPGGTTLAAARASERIRPLADPASEPDATHSPFDRRYQLNLIDRSGNVRSVGVPFSVDPNSIEWSADGHSLIVFGWSSVGYPSEGDIYRIDLTDLSSALVPTPGLTLANNRTDPDLPLTIGPARLLPFKAGVGVFARAVAAERNDWYFVTPDGEHQSLTDALGAVSGFPLYADAQGAVILSGEGAYRVAPGAAPERVTPVREGKFLSLTYRANAGHSWSYAFRFGSDLHRNDWMNVAPLVLQHPEGTGDAAVYFLDGPQDKVVGEAIHIPMPGARVLAASETAGAVLVTAKRGAATRMVLIWASGRQMEVARINDHLNRVAHPQARSFQYALVDPEQPDRSVVVDGCLTLPAGYVENQRYPLVVEVYPVGRPGRCDTLGDAAKPGLSLRDIWASLGFIHIRPALPLDMARTADGPLGGVGNLMDQVAAQLVAQGYADADRMVLYGFSQGGISALQAATQSDRFAAVISLNGWADYFSHYFGPRGLMRYFHLDQNGGDNRWRYDCLEEGADHFCPFGFGRSALMAPADYAASSPVALAHRIRSPVMLIHSDLDYFDMSQYDQMFGALYRAGKEAVYVRYWGEGHGPSSPANMRDLWERIDQFLQSTGVSGNSRDSDEAGPTEIRDDASDDASTG